MAKDHINTSHYILKELEENMKRLAEIIARGEHTVSNMHRNWLVLHETFKNFKRDLEENGKK